jgi:hypothetical protein
MRVIRCRLSFGKAARLTHLTTLTAFHFGLMTAPSFPLCLASRPRLTVSEFVLEGQ